MRSLMNFKSGMPILKIAVAFMLLVSFKMINAQDYNSIEGAITIQQQEGWDSGAEVYTTVGANFQPPASTCTNLNNRWFKFTATDSFLKLTIYGGTIKLIQYNLFTSNHTLVGCGQATAGLSIFSFERTDLMVGEVYYLSVASDNGNGGSFGLKVSTIKDYNYIEGATLIQHQEGWDSGIGVYTTVGANFQPPGSTCTNLKNRWFKFTATDSFLKMTIYGGTIKLIQYNLFTSNHTLVGCGQATAGLSIFSFERTDLMVGEVYYLSVASDNGNGGSFGVKVSTIKDYNYIEGAALIQHQEGWDSGAGVYTTVGANFQPPASTCTNLNNRWFKFIATDSFLKMTIYGGSIKLIQYNLFTSNHTLVGCGQTTAGLSTYTFERTDLIIGATYYLSVASDNGNGGSFGLRISKTKDYNYIEGAVAISHQEGWNSGPEAYTTVGANFQPPQSTCTSLNNRWFKFTATDSHLKMTVYGGTIAFIQYNLFVGSNYTPVGCGQAQAGLSVYTFERTDLVVGATYYLSVASSNNGKGSFGIIMQSGLSTGYWTLTDNVLHPLDMEYKVGIGTTTVPEGYKVGVKGKIIAEGVKVELKTKWPDYVFEDGYQLLSLEETRDFISEAKHLPGIPSAKKIESDGIDLGEMNALLLKKIEELTLHLINQKEEINLLKKRILQLEETN